MLGSFKFSLCMYRQFVQSFEVIMLTYIFVKARQVSHATCHTDTQLFNIDIELCQPACNCIFGGLEVARKS